MKTFRKKPLKTASAKAQSAMEYLMTYGWAILIISVVLAALFQLGVFNPMTFAPKAPPGSCQVFRPNGPGTTSFINLEGVCTGEIPQYVAQFNGYTSLITTPSLSRQIPTNSQITVTAWINVASLTSAGGAGCGAQRDIINLGGGAKFYLQASSGSSSTGNFPAVDILWVSNSTTNYGAGPGSSAPPIIPDQWFFIAGTNSNQHECAYLDSSGSCGPGLINMNSPGGGVIGWSDGCASSFNGSIADVQVYNTSLSPNEIQALYQEGIGGAPINLQHLVAWWPLNGNANDYSGNGYNGQTTNVNFVSNWYSGYTPP